MAYRDVDLMPEGEGEEDYENLEMIFKPADGAGQSMADNEATADSIYEPIYASQPTAPAEMLENSTKDAEVATMAS